MLSIAAEIVFKECGTRSGLRELGRDSIGTIDTCEQINECCLWLWSFWARFAFRRQ